MGVADFTINGGSTSPSVTSVTASSTVNLALVSTAGIDACVFTIDRVDDTQPPGGACTPGALGHATCVAGPAGSATTIVATVTIGAKVYRQRAKFFVPASISGKEVIAIGETNERGTSHGKLINDLIRTVGGGSSGSINVPNWAALLAFGTAGLPDGTVAFVQTLKRDFVLDSSSTSAADPGFVGPASNGGNWLSSTPSPFWVTDPTVQNYYLDDSASFENIGTNDAHPIPYREWVLRTSQPWPYNYGALMTLLNDCNIYRYDASWLGASNQAYAIFRAEPKTKILSNVSITAVTMPSPCVVEASTIVFNSGAKTATQASGDFTTDFKIGQLVRFEGAGLNRGVYTLSSVAALVMTFSAATIIDETVITNVVGIGGREGTVTIAGSMTSSVYKLAIINAGPRQGCEFWILKDNGGGVARISNVQTGPYDSFTPVDLQVGDTFDTWNLIESSGDFQQTGPFDESGSSFEYIHFRGQVNFGDATVGGLAACICDIAPSFYSDCQVTVGSCLVLDQTMELYTGAIVYLFGGAFVGKTSEGSISPDLGSYVGFRNYTLQNVSMTYGQITGTPGVLQIAESGWLAQFDSANALVMLPNSIFTSFGIHWGQNCTGPRITLSYSSEYEYAVSKPNLIGSGHDFSVLGVPIDPGQLPISVPEAQTFVIDGTGGNGAAKVEIRDGQITRWRKEIEVNTSASATPIQIPGLFYPFVANRGYEVALFAKVRGTSGAASGKIGFGKQTYTIAVDGSVTPVCINPSSNPIQDPNNAEDVSLGAFGGTLTIASAEFGFQITPLAASTLKVWASLDVVPGP